MITVGKLGNMVRNGLHMRDFAPFCSQFSKGEVALVPGSEALGAVSRDPHIVFRGERSYNPGSRAVPKGGDLVGALASGIASLSGRQVTIKDGGCYDGQVIKYIFVKLPDPGRVTGSIDAVPVFEEVAVETLLGSFRCFRSEPVDLWGSRDSQNPQPASKPKETALAW